MKKLMECVPNFSAGRDPSTIEQITHVIRQVNGVQLLDVDVGYATNRTVVTFIGEPSAVAEAAFRAIQKASQLIDMEKHQGAHARLGATDVCPFIPIENMDIAECVIFAQQLGERVGQELGIPVYLYEHAATTSRRKSLSAIREGEYEGLAAKIKQPDWQPDYGPAVFSAKSGATVIGARPVLIAYNINLNTRDDRVAKDIGLTIRESGRVKRDSIGNKITDAAGNPVNEPGFPHCRATGWYIEEYGCGQVTMNLTDYEKTPMHAVFDRVCHLAAERGVRVTGSEIVGLVPKQALLAAAKHFLTIQGTTPALSEDKLIRVAIHSLGLSDVSPFVPEKKIIEYQLPRESSFSQKTLADFCASVADTTPTPGGGTVAALAGSMGASLIAMVAGLSHGKKGLESNNATYVTIGTEAHQLQQRLLKLADQDSAAFNEVMAALRLAKKTPQQIAAREQALLLAYQKATNVPLEVLELSIAVLALWQQLAPIANPNALSDASVAAAMANACAQGAYENVRINLDSISDQVWKAKKLEHANNLIDKISKA